MHRFYIPTADFNSSQIKINNPKEIHHLVNVLRLKKTDVIHIFNRQNEEGEGAIISTSPQEVIVKISSSKKIPIQFPLITLACAIPKKSKFETIIEKATELGVYEIIPLKTKRTEIILNAERADKKQTRFETVAINAAKQSKRVNIPQIHPVTEFSKAVSSLTKESKVIIPSLLGSRIPLMEALKKNPKEKIAFLIGPEGDFTADEYKLAHSQGCIPVSLGETVLKVETAALCVVACAKQFYL